jgi:hypothetical protein
MVDSDQQITGMLLKMSIFKGLNRSQIEIIVERSEQVHLEKGKRLLSQGERGGYFFIILSGKVLVSRKNKRGLQRLAVLSSGDYLGEESLLSGRARSASADVVEAAHLLRLDIEDFSWMLRQFPQTKLFFNATTNSQRLSRKKLFDWLNVDETIYFVVQKHTAYLYTSLIGPLLVAWVALPVLYSSTLTKVSSFHLVMLWIGLLLLAGAVLWGVWNFIDWGNDYYIVTNQRVIWLEKVIAIYDNRIEAPLSTVLTVGIQKDQLARIFGYGDVIVRTYTGQIVMNRVGYPEQLAGLIEEQLGRSKQVQKKEERAVMEQTIRERLGMETAPKPVVAQAQTPAEKPLKNARSRMLENFFKVRLEEHGIITYRKHWILLVQKAWLPTLTLVLLLGVILLRIFNFYVFLPSSIVEAIGGLSILIVLFWWAYEYIDWSNDIYQVTSDQIIDIYRKPLGKEDKKVALLENILSLENKRRGIIGIIFNYGDVIAMVGAARFVFEGVYNPAAVEQDIFQRMGARKQMQKDAEATREREQIADWLEAYHRQTEVLRKKENPPSSDRNSG